MRIKPNLKAWVAGIGSTLTAATACLATVSVAVGDDVIDAQEISSIAGAVALMVGTVYGVWKAENKE